MDTVTFTRMAEGTRQDYQLLARKHDALSAELPERLLTALAQLAEGDDGYQVSRLEHSLQAATRAHRDGRPEDYVAATLVHDLGDDLAPENHSELAAAIVRPYVSDEVHWIIKHHGVFQMIYYAHHHGNDPHERERYRDHPHFAACAEFCENYDQVSFDPTYPSMPLTEFEPLLHRVFSHAQPHGH